jgi:hypothetical protein
MVGQTLVQTEWLQLYEATGDVTYRGDASAALFGFAAFQLGDVVKVVRTSDAPIITGFGTGSTGELRILYTKDADATETPSVIVPQDTIITLTDLQTEAAASTNFADFQARIAAL